jgi:hypothetical protein
MIKTSARFSLIFIAIACVVTAVVSKINLPGRDFIQFWTAGRALQAGVSPYDQNFEAITQQQNGWDLRREPIPFQPYFYPPWLAILMWPLAWLPYSLARDIGSAVNLMALVTSLVLMARAAKRPLGPMTLAVVIFMGFTFLPILNSLGVGQLHAVLLLILAGLVWSLDRQHDRFAGICLGLLSIKPQIGLIIAAFLIVHWILQRRWQPLRWTVLTGCALIGLSFSITPNWINEMLSAPQRFTDLTGWTFPLNGYQDDPTLWAALRVNLDAGSIGVAWPIGGLLILIALFILRARRLQNPSTHWVIAIACASVFIFSPYARLYDLSILLWPMIYFAFTEGSLVKRGISWLSYLFPIGTLLLNAHGVSNVITAYALLAVLLMAGPIDRDDSQSYSGNKLLAGRAAADEG